MGYQGLFGNPWLKTSWRGRWKQPAQLQEPALELSPQDHAIGLPLLISKEEATHSRDTRVGTRCTGMRPFCSIDGGAGTRTWWMPCPCWYSHGTAPSTDTACSTRRSWRSA